MKERGTNPRAVSLAIGKSAKYISVILSRSTPTIELFAAVADHLDTDIATLYYGNTNDDLQNKLIKEFSELDENEKEFVLRMLGNSIKKHKEPEDEQPNE